MPREQCLLLNLGQGDWQSGFPSVVVQLWEPEQQPIQVMGSLPPAPHLVAQYQRWQQLYEALYGTQTNWRRSAADFEFDMAELTNVSQHEFDTLCLQLQTDLNQWLLTPGFTPIERRIRTHLTAQSDLRVMLTAQVKEVLRFPWRLWHLFEDYPHAELSLSLPTYSRALKQLDNLPSGSVNILAVLGNDDGIDVEVDQKILDQLPSAQVTLLVQPTLVDLQQQLWSAPWDVLFFAGHSASQCQFDSQSQAQGHIQINATETLTIEQLKYALRRAISNGLQLAIFNSCDGLGLAWDLADLHLPQTIVMREPVPDAIAHQFLKDFLFALANGQTLYRSVREAREKLYGLSLIGNCASWLPLIVQNPAEIPPTWETLKGRDTTVPNPFATEQAAFPNSEFRIPNLQRQPVSNILDPSPQASSHRAGTRPAPTDSSTSPSAPTSPSLLLSTITSLSLAILTFAIRWLGLLQGLELWAYDALIRFRPYESPDPRIVVVTVNEADIQAQADLNRRGSLSDNTLQQALTTLRQYEPRLIGLDIYRDFPTQTSALSEVLSLPNIIGICKSRDPILDEVGIGPPPEIAADQVGFSDFIEDTDGVLRRQLLTLTPDPISPCTTRYGFAALLAIYYLRDEGVQSQFTAQGNFQLGDVVFSRLKKHSGGLQKIDHRGNQVLLHYRSLSSPDQIAATVPLEQLLNGQVNPQSIRDRIVIIGVTAPSGGDYWSTPYGIQTQERTPGVYLQAQMVSQLISAVLDGRPLIWTWPPWFDLVCYLSAAMLGSLCAYLWKSSQLMLMCLMLTLGLTFGAWSMLLIGGWFPLVPTLLVLSGSTLTATISSNPKASLITR